MAVKRVGLIATAIYLFACHGAIGQSAKCSLSRGNVAPDGLDSDALNYEAEDLTTVLQQLIVGPGKLRLELLKQRLENQEVRLVQMERELEQMRAERKQLEEQERAFVGRSSNGMSDFAIQRLLKLRGRSWNSPST